MIENPKKYYEQMIAYSVILSLISSFVFFSVLFPSQNSYARVIGPCSDCHTMHNSQGGQEVEGFIPFEDGGAANSTLLATTCIGCHTGENTDDSTTPYVMGTTEPIFGTSGNTLAGGNFYWVAHAEYGDEYGHNVAGISEADSNLVEAPGVTKNEGCAFCHRSIADPIFIEYGKNGCIGCHLIPKHHANDGTGTKLVDSAEQGWYRFLSGHETGTGKGVKGIEHKKWNYNANAGSHNEYLGNVQSGGDGFDDLLGFTTTAFCTGCHGQFHSEQKNESGQWIRHPSDFKIPDSGEYADAFGGKYDPDVPVARTSLADVVSSEVTTGSDMVMCLSCHVAHGSPYPNMLRWDYNKMIAGEGKDKIGGCFKCHTEKN